MSGKYEKKAAGETVAEQLAEHIRGKVILTTGVSPGGLGASFVQIIAKHEPKLLILAGRNTKKVKETQVAIEANVPGVKIRVLELDLNSQEQVRKAAAEVNAYEEVIDVLVNNSGIMAVPYGKTADGIEQQFGVNHIGHFLFTNLIIDKILASTFGGRVINISSDGYRASPIRWDWTFQNGENYDRWRAYGQSKTANMLYSVSLAEKLGKRGLLSYSLHPGAIWTNLGNHLADEGFGTLQKLDRELGNEQGWWSDFPWKNLSQGAATHIFAAFEPTITGQNGAFCTDVAVVPPEQVSAYARDSLEAAKLWKISEELVGQKFEFN